MNRCRSSSNNPNTNLKPRQTAAYIYTILQPLLVLSESASNFKDGTQTCRTWLSPSRINKICLFTVCNCTVCKINLLTSRKLTMQSVNSHRRTALPTSRPCSFFLSINVCLTAFLQTSHQSHRYRAQMWQEVQASFYQCV